MRFHNKILYLIYQIIELTLQVGGMVLGAFWLYSILNVKWASWLIISLSYVLIIGGIHLLDWYLEIRPKLKQLEENNENIKEEL